MPRPRTKAELIRSLAGPPPAADFDADFDADSPPPRTTPRPTGAPLPPYLRVTESTPVPALFLDWCASGRIDPRSFLCEFVGTRCGQERHSGYKVVAESPHPDRSPLGGPGQYAPAEALEQYRVAVVVHEPGRPAARLVVMSPRGGR